MSIIMRNISGRGSSSSNGFPPGDVSDVYIRSGVGNVLLSWLDPENTVENGTTLSTWSSTIIVKKEGSAPFSIKDGDVILTNTTKNKYKSIPYTDSNVTVGKTYYYRFYTLSADKVYNDSTSMIYSVKVVNYDPILKNNSWGSIAAVSEAKKASDIWNIGDEIDITLSGTFNETVTLQIWDFNHFDKSDGFGKVGIVFGMKHMMKKEQQMNNYDTNYGGWNDTYMKKTVMQNILSSMPSDLQSYIKEVNTYANEGDNSISPSTGKLSKDKVFLPGSTEVGFTGQSDTESNQKKFPIFTDDDSRIKKMNNGNGDANYWWTRSPSKVSYSDSFNGVSSDGTGSSNRANTTLGICFCFNV